MGGIRRKKNIYGDTTLLLKKRNHKKKVKECEIEKDSRNSEMCYYSYVQIQLKNYCPFFTECPKKRVTEATMNKAFKVLSAHLTCQLFIGFAQKEPHFVELLFVMWERLQLE